MDSSLPGMMFSGSCPRQVPRLTSISKWVGETDYSCPTLSNIDALYLDIHAGELVRCVEADISGSYPIKSVSGA